MEKWCNSRLTVLGRQVRVARFLKSKRDLRLHARHLELIENSPGRFVCMFETEEAPLEALRGLSRRFPDLIFLLDHESDPERVKGLAKAHGGQLQHFEVSY